MSISDAADPTRNLTDPAARTETILGQPFSNIGVVLDWMSPSHIVNEFIKQAVGYDLIGEAAEVFGGDWETVWRIAGVYRNLGSAMQDIGINVSQGNVHVDPSWKGNAADAAFIYFAGLSSAISSQRIALTELADQYEKAAEGAYRLAESFSGLMKDMIDAALIGIAGASAGTATITTGVGFVTGWGIAAYEAYKIGSIAITAREIISTAAALMNGVVGGIQAVAADIDQLVRFPLPANGYRHPGDPT